MTAVVQLRVLLIDDSPDDALLITEAISGQDFDVQTLRVDDAPSLHRTLRMQPWDIVICDYSMPYLVASDALRIVRELDEDLPFLVVSGVIGEDAAVAMMRAGAVDYVMKDRLTRLLPAIRREMRDAETRKSRDTAEAALNELRTRLQRTVERAPVGIANVAQDGRFLHVNPRFCEMLGYTCDELMAMTFSDITLPADVGRGLENVARMMNGDLPEYRTEKRYRHKDGSTVHVSLSTAPVLDEAGAFQYFASILLDITEKKQMESALSERDERYRQIVDTAQEGIWTVDAENRTTFVNPSMATMLGYTQEEMLGRPIHAFVHASETARLDNFTSRRKQGLSDEDDFVMRCKDSSRLRIHFTASPLRAADGSRAGSLAMVTDVTARWTAEEMVLQQKQELEEAQRIAHLGSWRRSLPGNALQWSDELYRIFDVSREVDPTFDLLLDLVDPEDRERVRLTMARVLDEGAPLDILYRIVRTDGTERTLHTVGEITYGADGAPQQLRGVTQDVTDRIAADKVHERLDRHVQLLLQSTTQGIFGMDTKGLCTFVNRSASESLGYADGQLVGVSMHDLVHPTHEGGAWAATGTCPIQTAVSTGTMIEVQTDLLARHDGSMLPVEYSVAPVLDLGVVTGAVVVFTDVSERKLLQAQLEQSDRVSSLGRLAATMAHEFNNVLMGIQPFAEILSRQSSGTPMHGATQSILQTVQRGRSITQGILRFARPAQPVKEKVDVGAWLRSMELSLRAILGGAIELNLDIDGEALLVRGDRHQLEQVLTNLAGNARDAMQGRGTVSVFLERCVSGAVYPFGAIRMGDHYLHLRISDTGSGMDARTLKNIFDPFFTTKRAGTGLGLAVVHQILTLHGGSIVAESVVGEGTVFHLFLPSCEEAMDRVVASPAPAAMRSVHSVLVIEDEEAIRIGITDLLREEGLRVDMASNGAAALEALAVYVPDAVLLDVGLPDIDGRLLYERIALHHPDLAIVFASGSSDEDLLRPYLKSGQIASIPKPYEFSALLDVLASLNVVPLPATPAEALP
jgi:PAS domain S-box-containing protein